MSNDKPLPSYTEAMTALVTFVSRVAKDDTNPLKEEAIEVLGDFILAGLVKLGERRNPQTLEELEKQNPDGFRNPVYTRWQVVEISTGDYVHKAFHNHNGAQSYCEELNRHAGGPSYKVVGVE